MKDKQTQTDFAQSTNNETSGQTNFISSIKTFLIIIGSSLITLIATRNTITWYFERFWGASADFWQNVWNFILQLFSHDHYSVCVFGTFIWAMIVYWSFGLIYTFIDLTGKPSFILKYKIQDNTKVSLKQIIPVIKQVLINQFAVGLPFAWIGYYLSVWRGSDFSPKLPTFHWVSFEIAVFIVIEEIGFYYTHRLLHNPRIYKYVHKKHHEWTSPIAITAVYCHPIEHFFSNIFPIYLGPLVLGSHLATTWLWFTIATLSTLNAHCGMHFPFFPSPEAHDFHHLKFNQNYGVLGVMDRFHGTDSLFRKTKAYDRHLMLLSLVPIKELYPEVKKDIKNS